MQQIGEEPYSSNPLLPYEERGREGGQHQLLVVWPVVVELDFNVLSTIQGHLRTDSWIQHSIRQTMHDLPPAVHTRQGLRNIWSGAWRDLDTNPSSQNRPRPEAHRERERGGGYRLLQPNFTKDINVSQCLPCLAKRILTCGRLFQFRSCQGLLQPEEARSHRQDYGGWQFEYRVQKGVGSSLDSILSWFYI